MRHGSAAVGVRQGGRGLPLSVVRRNQPRIGRSSPDLSVVRTAADVKGPTHNTRPAGFARGPIGWGERDLHRRELEREVI